MNEPDTLISALHALTLISLLLPRFMKEETECLKTAEE